MDKIEIYFDRVYRGIIGEFTFVDDLYVGDIVQVMTETSTYNLMVVYDSENNRFSIQGFMSMSLLEIIDKYKVSFIISHKVITEDLYKMVAHDAFNIKLKKAIPKLTMKELIKLVGYEFELAEED